MDFSRFFGLSSTTANSSFEEIYKLNATKEYFIDSDILSTYVNILTDCIERTYGIPDKNLSLLWDNCLGGESKDGLITMLSNAMAKRRDLFLVYKPSINLLRLADQQEQTQIAADYKKMGESKVGIYISFKNYYKSEMFRVYSDLEYCSLNSINKKLNLSKAVQIKISNLRASVNMMDSEATRAQASDIADALRCGKDVLLDKDDMIETSSPEISSNKEALNFINNKKSNILRMPTSYITGEQTGGIGSSGENDNRAVERGLKGYFVSILKPVLDTLFSIDVEFKESDFRDITSKMEVIKTFDLVSDELLSRENKLQIISRIFDVDFKENSKQVDEPNDQLRSFQNPTQF